MRADKTFGDLGPREVVHIHCVCGRERVLMPITLLSKGKVRGKTTIHGLKKRLRCRSCRHRPATVWIEKWKD
jgi:hypothetical protein